MLHACSFACAPSNPQATPWRQTDAYLSAMGKGISKLGVTLALRSRLADPTGGRGKGLSYLREDVKKNMTASLKSQKDGNITGRWVCGWKSGWVDGW